MNIILDFQDTLGESILVCTETQARSGKELVCAKLQPISSCLDAANNVSSVDLQTYPKISNFSFSSPTSNVQY
jgi:hypothetical protein